MPETVLRVPGTTNTPLLGAWVVWARICSARKPSAGGTVKEPEPGSWIKEKEWILVPSKERANPKPGSDMGSSSSVTPQPLIKSGRP